MLLKYQFFKFFYGYNGHAPKCHFTEISMLNCPRLHDRQILFFNIILEKWL